MTDPDPRSGSVLENEILKLSKRVTLPKAESATSLVEVGDMKVIVAQQRIDIGTALSGFILGVGKT